MLMYLGSKITSDGQQKRKLFTPINSNLEDKEKAGRDYLVCVHLWKRDTWGNAKVKESKRSSRGVTKECGGSLG